MTGLQIFTVMILGDDFDAMESLREYIADREELVLKFVTTDCREAERVIKKEELSIILVDINHSGGKIPDFLRKTGLQTVKIISAVTDRFALEAFDIGVTDYLLKPFSKERFNKAIERAKIYQTRSGKKAKDIYDIMEKYNIFLDRLQNKYRLTDNYYAICKLIIKEKNRKDIMEALNISANSLKVYLRDIYSKTIDLDNDTGVQRKNKFHQLYLFLHREFNKI